MVENLASVKAKVELVIQTSTDFIHTSTDGEMEQSVREALERYSNDAPREIVTDVAGDGSTFDLTLPATYDDGFSRVVSVEYPAGERIPLYVDGNEFSIYRTSSTFKLRLHSDTPSTGQTVRIVTTAAHTLDDLDAADATTIPTRHTHAFVNLAASKCLLKLATRFGHEQESTLNADSVDRNSKGDVFRRLAGTLERDYAEVVGVTRGSRPALSVIDWDVAHHQGLYGLTHRRRVV